MMHAAAMLAVLWLAAMLLTGGWDSAQGVAASGVCAFAATSVAARLNAFSRGAGPFARAPQLVMLNFARIPGVLRGALATAQASISADAAMRPALVRVKTRPSSDLARAVLTDAITAAPGALVVESDVSGLLVHVLEEEKIDAGALSRIEQSVLKAVDGRVSE